MRSRDFERITWSAPLETSRPLLDDSPARALRQIMCGAACAVAVVAAGYGCAQITTPAHHAAAPATATTTTR